MKPMTNLMRTLAAGAIVAVGLAGAAVAQDLKFFTIGTGGTGYTYYPVGGLIANAISKPPGSRPCDEGGSCGAFTITLVGGMMGLGGLGVAFSGFFLSHLTRAERWWIAIVSLLLIAPGLKTMALGLVLWLPILILQLRRRSAQAV